MPFNDQYLIYFAIKIDFKTSLLHLLFSKDTFLNFKVGIMSKLSLNL